MRCLRAVKSYARSVRFCGVCTQHFGRFVGNEKEALRLSVILQPFQSDPARARFAGLKFELCLA